MNSLSSKHASYIQATLSSLNYAQSTFYTLLRCPELHQVPPCVVAFSKSKWTNRFDCNLIDAGLAGKVSGKQTFIIHHQHQHHHRRPGFQRPNFWCRRIKWDLQSVWDIFHLSWYAHQCHFRINATSTEKVWSCRQSMERLVFGSIDR